MGLMIIIVGLNLNYTFAIDSIYDDDDDGFSIIGSGVENSYQFHGDYSPPTPPPPVLPPLPPSASCEGDLRGFGSLESVCKLNSSIIILIST